MRNLQWFLLRGAMGFDGVVVTDDAAAMEYAGYTPRLVAGSGDNIKITVPEDLALAIFHLHRRPDT